MQTQCQLLHTWQRQLRTLLPQVRATRVANLALFRLGLLWAGTVSLPAVAAALPVPAQDASLERRLRRWLTNRAVVVRDLWTPLLPGFLAAKAGQDVTLVFDPTPQNGLASVLVLGIVDHRRVLPLAWRVLPQQEPWTEPRITLLRAMVAEVVAALPADCEVTLLADRGITSPAVIALCTAVGWHFVLRVNAGASQANRVQRPAEAERALWELVTSPGQRWASPARLFKEAGWRELELTLHWDRAAREPWVLVSDRPGGFPRVREYRRRVRAEATYQDCQRRGFGIEASKITDLARFDRLLLALHLALWWGTQLGLRAIRTGQRRRFDRADRRELSVLRLGRVWLVDRLWHGVSPPVPFHCRHHQWRYTWLA